MKRENLMRAVKAYKAGRTTNISGDPRTIADDIETWDANQAMWGRHHQRRANRRFAERTLAQRYQDAIYAAAQKFASAKFGSRVAVSTILGNTDSVAWLGGDRAVVTVSYQRGPQATVAALAASADECLSLIPRLDRGIIQSLDYIVSHAR